MIAFKRKYAVYAGLFSSYALVCPHPAYALSVESVATNPYVQFSVLALGSFALGSGIGWVVMKIVSPKLGEWYLRIIKPQSTREIYKNASRFKTTDEVPAHEVEIPLTKAYKPKHMKVIDEQSLIDTSTLSKLEVSSKHKAVGLEEIAENYSRKEAYKTNRNTRSKGVAAVLAERLGIDFKSRMEGIPVIQRADGSVGDIGTTWWDKALVDQELRQIDFDDFKQMDGIKLTHGIYSEQPATSVMEATGELQAEITGVQKRAYSLKDRVPLVVEEKFPELKVESQDVWSEALAALDERVVETSLPEVEIAFNDVIGDSTTLDDPDGMEQVTTFIPFKPSQQNAEFRDIDSYIDYLISSEFSKSRSSSARRNAREYLKVIEGGTAEFKTYVPEHFKKAKEA